jgi:transposase-like protein
MAGAKQTATAEPETTAEAPATAAERPVKDVIREMFDAGKSRSEIAKELGVSYQRVFSLTKGKTNASTTEGGARPKVVLEGLEGEDARFNGVARVEAARTLYGEGVKVGPIAKRLGTSYQIIFQATRGLRDQATAAETPDEGDEVEDTADGDVDVTGEEIETEDDDDDE